MGTADSSRVPAALVAEDAARLIELVRAQHHTSDTASGGFVCFGCTRTGWSVPFPCIYARLATALEASQLDLQVAALRAPAALDPDRQRRLKKIRQDARVLETAIPRSMPILEKRMAREDVPWLLEELATAQQRTEALWGLVYDLSGEGGMSFRRTSDYQSYIQRAEQLIEADWPNSEPYVSKIHEDIRYLDAQLAAAHSELAALRASAEPALSPSLRSRVNSANGAREVVQAAIAWRAVYRAVADATSREYPGDTEDAAPRWVEGMTRASVEYSTAEDALGAAVDALLTVRDGRGG